MDIEKTQVVILGAGMAGLTCALELERRGVDYRLLEAREQVGGRVATDEVEGFLLDRGFQVLLSGYPELRRILNYQTLKLRPIRSGAVIRQDGRNLVLPNPLRDPQLAWQAWRSPVGTRADKLRVAWLGLRSLLWREPHCFAQRQQTTREFLEHEGFSQAMIETFWRPFLGGVFLDDELSTGADLFRFLMPLFAWSSVVLPSGGMGQIPRQIERRLNRERIVLGADITSIEGKVCRDARGRAWQGDQLVVALDGAGAGRLLGCSDPVYRGTHCSYFAAPASPGGRGRLHLVADREAPVHHWLVISDSVPGYAPAGQSLISVSSQGRQCPSEEVLRGYFSEIYGAGPVEQWRLLRQYSIPQALPAFHSGQGLGNPSLGAGLWRCGDAHSYPSLNAAVASGRRVAELLGYGSVR